ncbi:leukemia-associated protein 7 [Neopsephotus bourkii]|uniref:leukemia-associated protein 7 n=1 Tax=Neopsephotus bourkii TaxID=309878 RepID=UPI002AA556B0|nr:leukemia-associated protein 7 [Neopsephotus bourkii]
MGGFTLVGAKGVAAPSSALTHPSEQSQHWWGGEAGRADGHPTGVRDKKEEGGKEPVQVLKAAPKSGVGREVGRLMARPSALLVSIRHQAEALCTLQDAAAPHSPHSPPQPSHTQTFSASRSGTYWHIPRAVMELSEPGGAQQLEEERKAPGKSPKEEGSGDLTPLRPGEPRPERLAWPRLARCETLREKALRSKMSRIVEVTSRLVQVEQSLLLPLLEQHPLPLHPKDSIEFRNICTRMVLQREGQQFDRDLREAHQCLKTIIEKLICSLAAFASDSCIPVLSALRQIQQDLLAI